jgi:hypothetical protein
MEEQRETQLILLGQAARRIKPQSSTETRSLNRTDSRRCYYMHPQTASPSQHETHVPLGSQIHDCQVLRDIFRRAACPRVGLHSSNYIPEMAALHATNATKSRKVDCASTNRASDTEHSLHPTACQTTRLTQLSGLRIVYTTTCHPAAHVTRSLISCSNRSMALLDPKQPRLLIHNIWQFVTECPFGWFPA